MWWILVRFALDVSCSKLIKRSKLLSCVQSCAHTPQIIISPSNADWPPYCVLCISLRSLSYLASRSLQSRQYFCILVGLRTFWRLLCDNKDIKCTSWNGVLISSVQTLLKERFSGELQLCLRLINTYAF